MKIAIAYKPHITRWKGVFKGLIIKDVSQNMVKIKISLKMRFRDIYKVSHHWCEKYNAINRPQPVDDFQERKKL